MGIGFKPDNTPRESQPNNGRIIVKGFSNSNNNEVIKNPQNIIPEKVIEKDVPELLKEELETIEGMMAKIMEEDPNFEDNQKYKDLLMGKLVRKEQLGID